MGAIVFSLCALTAFACAVLLWRAYARTPFRLLMWSGTCFALLAASNVLIALDLLAFPEIDFFLVRNLTTLLALGCLLYGFIWDSR